MNEITSLMDAMKEKLSASAEFSGVTVGFAYSGDAVSRVADAPFLLIEQSAATLNGIALDSIARNQKRVKKVKAAVRFTIFSPVVLGPERCTALFYALCGELLFDDAFPIQSMSAGSIKPDEEKFAYVLTATALLETMLDREEIL